MGKDVMKVLIACEESQTVCKAFRELGHEAYSCDIQECSGNYPEWHIKGDCVPLLGGHCSFKTMDGTKHEISDKWDLIIAHPPCTHLASSGARWFREKQQSLEQQKACVFFMRFILADCEHIAVENPVGIMSTVYQKPTQIIQPFEYGDPHRKTTCLWLKGLEPLKPTNIVEPEIIKYTRHNGKTTTFDSDYIAWPSADRAKKRSKTYHGIAKAMAEQWGNLEAIKHE